MSRTFALLALVVAATAPFGSPARAAGLDPCTGAIAKAVESYAKGKYKVLASCEDKRSKGSLAASVNCRPAAGAVTDASTADKLTALADKVAATIGKKCTGPLPPLGPACNSATTVAALSACIAAPVQDADVEPINVDTLIDTAYDTNAPVDATLRGCQAGLSKAIAKYLPARMKALRKCAANRAGGKTDVCPDADTAAALEAARVKADDAMRGACTDAQLAASVAPKLDFGISCRAYKLVSFVRGPSNTNALPVTDRLVRCLTDAAAGVADRSAAIGLPNPETSGFAQGVAAGDATESEAIFWTRLPNPVASASLDVSTDPTFPPAGTQTLAVSDPSGVVKEEVGSLLANTTYYYRFRQGAETSAVGRVTTTPEPDDATTVVRLGWSGDSNAYNQPFTSLDPLRLAAPAAWLYIGDTIYGDSPQADGVVAMTEPEYDAKYYSNRADASLRNLMASTGTYVMWDDHEVRNDFSGAVPAFATRLAAGNASFRRNMPMHDDHIDPMQLYRSTRWGSGAEFFLVDYRQYRSAKYTCCSAPNEANSDFVLTDDDSTCGGTPGEALIPSASCQTAMDDPARTVLGATQKQWLKDGLLNSTATFKFIMNGPPVTQLLFLPYDRWEAWSVERDEILDFIETNNIKNVIWLSTDFHTIIFSPNHLDIAGTHPVPELVAGYIGEDTLFNELPASVLGLLGSVPAIIPQVSEYELDRYNTCLITIDPTQTQPTATFDFTDRTGLLIHSIAFTATP
jgi:alkaline phosphatase D